MTYIKWKRRRPFVYKSVRERRFKAESDHGGNISIRTLEDRIKSEYLGSYESYRMNKPCGSYTNMMKAKKVLDMLADERWKLDMLARIDAEAHEKYC
jgi:hypothetical protein